MRIWQKPFTLLALSVIIACSACAASGITKSPRYDEVAFIGKTSITRSPVTPAPTVPMTPVTTGFTAYVIDTDGYVIAVGSSPFDHIFADAAEGARRYPPMLKASILNPICDSADASKRDSLSAFCDGKTMRDCVDTIEVPPEFTESQMYQLWWDQCLPPHMRAADRAITFVESSRDFPAKASASQIYCACEGTAAKNGEDEPIVDGPCFNRWICLFIDGDEKPNITAAMP